MEYNSIIFYNNKFNEIYPTDAQSDGILEIKDYLNKNTVANFPDINSIARVMGGARNLQKKWNPLNRKDKVEMLQQTGEMLLNRSNYDKFIASCGGFPIKYVEETRKEIYNYLKDSENLLQKDPGKGPVVAATSVTSPMVQPYVIMEAILGNCSVIIKGDSKEPFSAYLIAEISLEIGLPIQFITYKIRGKESFANELYNMCKRDGGNFILMGDSSTPKKIAYGNLLNETDLMELPLPQNMIAFTAHGGAMIVDESCNISKAVQGAIDSFKYPRACKVPTVIFVYKSIIDEFICMLEKEVSKQNVGNVLCKDTDVAELPDSLWDSADDFIRVAKSNGKVRRGGRINDLTIIEGHFYSSLSMEPQFPVYCVEEIDNIDGAIEKINSIGSKSFKQRLLDLSIYSEDKAIIKNLQNMRVASLLNVFSLHFNLPTISFNPHTAHEGIILREFLSEPNFIDPPLLQ